MENTATNTGHRFHPPGYSRAVSAHLGSESAVSDPRPEAPGPEPTPRDMPDQQADSGADDPWEPADDAARPDDREESEPDPDIPDTDEAGTGRRGAPHSGSPRPEHPVPDEPSG